MQEQVEEPQATGRNTRHGRDELVGSDVRTRTVKITLQNAVKNVIGHQVAIEGFLWRKQLQKLLRLGLILLNKPWSGSETRKKYLDYDGIPM